MKTFASPSTVSELNEFISNNKNRNIVFLAGGTDLLVDKVKFNTADIIIDLSKTSELRNISVCREKINIGSTCTMTDIAGHKQLKNIFPLLVNAATKVGCPQIRNRATIAGNIANASPAGDTIPVLSVAEAKIRIFNLEENKELLVPINKFFLGPGQTILKNGDYIVGFEVPTKFLQNCEYAFYKVGQRQALSISKLSVTCLYQLSHKNIHKIRMAAGSVAPTVKRLYKTEEYLQNSNLSYAENEVMRFVKSEIEPITDVRSTAEYRKEITGRLVLKCLQEMKS